MGGGRNRAKSRRACGAAATKRESLTAMAWVRGAPIGLVFLGLVGLAGPTLSGCETDLAGAFAGPAVALGHVYVADRQLTRGASNDSDPTAPNPTRSLERVLCLNETDGLILWQYEYECPYTISYPAGPRAAPMISEGKAYTLGAEGNLLCLDAGTGKVLWSHDFKKDFDVKAPMWGFAGHPLLDPAKPGQHECAACKKQFRVGDETTLVTLMQRQGLYAEMYERQFRIAEDWGLDPSAGIIDSPE